MHGSDEKSTQYFNSKPEKRVLLGNLSIDGSMRL
jgi:hypothetical protein